MERLNGFSGLDASVIPQIREEFGTPAYLYDERLIIERCRDCLAMPNAFGITVRFAMKANSNRTILKLITDQGLHIDASSLNEARRANMAGVPAGSIVLTTQEVPQGDDRRELERLLLEGMLYNVCSLHQLRQIRDFAGGHKLSLSIRVHPGVGSGESATRNTGDKYSCFGVHLSDIGQAVALAAERGLVFRHVHVHIGSGADPEMWRQNIDRELGIIKKHFADAESVCFGGGLREARMPDETAADIIALGDYAKRQIEAFYARTGRKLHMEIEPGTYIVANSGYVVTQVLDMKNTGDGGFDFIIADGGMEVNARPLLYGSRHPFYVISAGGKLLSSEFTGATPGVPAQDTIVAGKCCESGDCQTLDDSGHVITRGMAKPEIGDLLVVGGAGAYVSTMTPFNYNSHTQIPEVLYTQDGGLRLIRRRQTLEQIVENEI